MYVLIQFGFEIFKQKKEFRLLVNPEIIVKSFIKLIIRA